MPKRKNKKIRKTFTHGGDTVERWFFTKSEANEWYDMMRRQSDRMKAGLSLVNPNTPMGIVAGLWIKSRKLSNDYWRDDERKMRLCFVPALGEKPIQAVTKTDCKNALFAYRLDEGLSDASFNRYRACLHTFFEYVITEKYREDNPVTDIEMFKEKRRGVLVEDEEVERYLAVAAQQPSRWFLPFIVTGMNTGLRRGELLALTVADYEAAKDRGFYEVSKRYQTEHGRVKEGTKGGAERIVPINDFVIEVTDSFLAASEHKNGATPLFHKIDGTMANPNTLAEIHKRVRKRAGLSPEVRIYDITRHKYGSSISMQTGNQRLVQKLLGHSTPAITERYSHANKAFLSQARAVVIGKPNIAWEKGGATKKTQGTGSDEGEA